MAEPSGHKRPRDTDAQSAGSDCPWSYDKNTPPRDVPVRLLPQFAQLVNSDDPKDQLQGTLMIRKLLIEEQHIDAAVASQVVPRFVSFLLRDDFVDLQLEASWALTNITVDDPIQTRSVMEQQDAVPSMVHLLTSPSEDVRGQAAWILGNIAGDSVSSRDCLLNQGVLKSLLQCITTSNDNNHVIRTCVFAVSRLCCSKPSPDLDTVCEALPLLVSLLGGLDEEIVADACYALSYISDGPPTRIERVLAAGALPQVTDLLTSVHSVHQAAAAAFFANVAAGSEAQKQLLASCGCLPFFRSLLAHPRRTIRQETCRALSNFVAGAPERVQAVINAQLFPSILACNYDSADEEIDKEVLSCVANLSTSGTPGQIGYVVEELDLFRYVVQVLKQADSVNCNIALDAIHSILEVGKDEKQRRSLAKNPYAELFIDTDGVSALEQLKVAPSADVALIDDCIGLCSVDKL